MWKWMLLLWLAGPCQAENWHEFTMRLQQQGVALASQLPASWGGEMSAQDLQPLLAALQGVSQWGVGEDRPLSQALVADTRSTLSRYRQRLRVSLSTLPNPAPALDWLTRVEQLEQHLDQLQKGFGGYHLPTQVQLAQSSWDRDWTLPDYADPAELFRQARSLREDVQFLTSPTLNHGNGLDMIGSDYLPGWPGGPQLQDLMQAAIDYESICDSHYQDVQQTQKAYARLRHLFDRVAPAPNTTWRGRNVARTLERLDRFYQAMDAP